jgi:PAS domain S-box-containing protein
MVSQGPTRLPKQFEQLRVGIALFDPESGTIVDANESLESMFGYSTEALRKMSVEAYSANTYAFSRDDVVQQIQQQSMVSPSVSSGGLNDKTGG